MIKCQLIVYDNLEHTNDYYDDLERASDYYDDLEHTSHQLSTTSGSQITWLSHRLHTAFMFSVVEPCPIIQSGSDWLNKQASEQEAEIQTAKWPEDKLRSSN